MTLLLNLSCSLLSDSVIPHSCDSFDKVYHPMPFTLTRSVILLPSFWQGLSSCLLYPDNVCYLLPFTLTRPVILSPSPWRCLSSYFLHPDNVSHLIPFTVRFAILSSSPWQGLSSCPLQTWANSSHHLSWQNKDRISLTILWFQDVLFVISNKRV